MANELPKNWVKTKLKNLAIIQSGGTPARSNNSYWGGEIPWVKISDLKEFYISDTKEYITEEGLKNSSTRVFPKGTILFTIFATIGKVGVLNIDASTNQAIAGITPHKKINPKYLTFSLIELSNEILGLGKGVAQKNINQTILKNTVIPLPPLAEQNRIVTKLDDLFERLDKIKSSLDHIPVLLKNFRQQVLTQAVTGKLTEVWRKQEGRNLGEWEEKKIKEITTKVGSGSTPKGGSASYKSTGIPLIRSMNIHFEGIKYKGLAYIDDKQAEKLKNVIIEENDVLLNITGASIGRVCLAPKEMKGARVNQHVSIIRTDESILPPYLNIYLGSKIIQDYIFKENYGVTRQALTKTQLLNINIKLPHLKEQKEIVSRVENLFAKADAIQQQYEALKVKIEQLPQAILHKAFKGELVPQLESDGEAKDLLKQIEALKAHTKTKKTKKKTYTTSKTKLSQAAESESGYGNK